MSAFVDFVFSDNLKTDLRLFVSSETVVMETKACAYGNYILSVRLTISAMVNNIKNLINIPNT